MVRIRDGQKAPFFGEDRWFLIIFIVPATAALVKSNSQAITFTRWLVDESRVSWKKFLAEIAIVHLRDGNGVISWKFGNKGHFTVKSVYNALTSNEPGPYLKRI